MGGTSGESDSSSVGGDMTGRHQARADVHVDDAPTAPIEGLRPGAGRGPRRGLVIALAVVAATAVIGGVGIAALGGTLGGPACPSSASTVSSFGISVDQMPTDEFIRNADGAQGAVLADAVKAFSDSACAYLPSARPSRYSYEEGLIVVSAGKAIPQRMEGLRLFRQVVANAPSPVSGIAIESSDGSASGVCLRDGSVVTIYAKTAAEGPDDWPRAGIDKLAAALGCTAS